MHGAVYKVTRDILKVGDVWATDLSKLELHNADTKRTAKTGGSKRTETCGSGQSIKPLRVKEGPALLVTTKGYSTSLSISTLRKLLSLQYLRRGDGIIATPQSREKERLFGETGTGRLTLPSTGNKYEALLEYSPQADTCIKAFVHLLAERAQPQP